jgi:uncharacterized membrane protein YeiH
MLNIHAVLIVLAIVFFLLATFEVSTWRMKPWNFTALGLALWALSGLIV